MLRPSTVNGHVGLAVSVLRLGAARHRYVVTGLRHRMLG